MTAPKRPWSPPQIIFSALGGIALWTAVGFSWFGNGFNWETQGSAMRMSAAAVVENQAEICVAQARTDADTGSAMAAFEDLNQWKRSDFVETAGWATMPGGEKAKGGVADRCATKLAAS